MPELRLAIVTALARHRPSAPRAENDEPPSARWNRTVRALKRVEWQLGSTHLPGYGIAETYQGRHVIGRDRPILNGVYLGAHAREAIVVSEDEGILPRAYLELRHRLGILPKLWSERALLRFVHGYVRERMPGGQDATNALLASYLPSGGDDRKIVLSAFVAGKAGVCRHRALFAGYLIERLIRDELLQGMVSVDRSEEDDGGHAWVRFTSKRTGRIYIVDAGLDECGELYAIRAEWDYRRPTDAPPTPRKQRVDWLDGAILLALVGWAASSLL